MLVVNQAVRKYAALESKVITKLSGHNDTNPAVVASKLKLLKDKQLLVSGNMAT